MGGVAGEISRRLLANGVAGEPVDGLSTQEVSQEVIRFLRLGDHGGALDLAGRAFLKSPRDEEWGQAVERVRGVRTQGWFWDPVDCVQGVWTFREMTVDAWVNRVRELCE